MSRQLPARPNLEHLRNQAKDLLQRQRTLHPEWTLADAQRALARGYGFGSWPLLKQHVESAAAAGSGAAAPRPDADRSAAGSGQDGGSKAEANGFDPGHLAFVGTWTANLSLSRPHPAHPFRHASLQMAISGDRITLSQLVVDDAGREAGGTMTIHADGEEHPAGGAQGHMLVARWISGQLLEAIDRKDGQIVGRGTYEVSQDGSRLTVSTGEQVIVFDRA